MGQKAANAELLARGARVGRVDLPGGLQAFHVDRAVCVRRHESRIGRGIPALEAFAAAADTGLVRARGNEQGFGLIELLMAMTMLSVGILAIVASFNAGMVSLRRASKITTAAVLADQQMEGYRAIKWGAIHLDTTSANAADADSSDPTYKSDTGREWATAMEKATCNTPSVPPECNPRQTLTGADGRSYRLNTYILAKIPPNGRPVKQVTVVVRDAANLATVYARQSSRFDQSTG